MNVLNLNLIKKYTFFVYFYYEITLIIKTILSGSVIKKKKIKLGIAAEYELSWNRHK
jgi:hypothetical protein